MRGVAIVAGWALGLAACVPAWAEDPGLAPEDVLVTATRVPTAVADISAGVTVIDRAQMLARGYTTLAQALSAVPGAGLVAYGGFGNASLFLRGADSDQVQVLIDGVPVNDASGPGGAYNFGTETLAGVARIEVVRGPMSAVYGSGAIGGVVNLITERGTGAATGSVTVAGGLPAAVLGQAELSGSRGAFDWSVAGETQSARGDDATPRREAGHTGEPDGFRARLGDLDVGYTPVAGTRLFVDVRGRTAVYGYDDVGYPAFDDPNETGRDNDLVGRAGVSSTPLPGWQSSISASRDQRYRRYTNLLDAADPNGTAEDSRYLSRRTDVQWNNTVALPWGAALTGGYEHVAETARQRLDAVFGGFPYLATVAAGQVRDAGYAGVQGRVFGRLALAANVREEAVSGLGTAFTWRAGGSYALPFRGSHLKASFGTAYLAPSLFDRFGVDSGGYVGNPALRPERSRGGEVGWSAPIGSAATMELTWFRTQARDLIQTQFVPVYTSVNVAAARLTGLEAAVHWQPAAWIDADATYSYTDARNSRTGALLLRRPYDAGSVTVAVRPVAGVSVVPQVTWRGGDADALVDDAGYPAGIGRNGGGAVLNLNLAWQVRRDVMAFVWGKNLNDSRAESASGFAQPGPSFLAGVRLSE